MNGRVSFALFGTVVIVVVFIFDTQSYRPPDFVKLTSSAMPSEIMQEIPPISSEVTKDVSQEALFTLQIKQNIGQDFKSDNTPDVSQEALFTFQNSKESIKPELDLFTFQSPELPFDLNGYQLIISISANILFVD